MNTEENYKKLLTDWQHEINRLNFYIILVVIVVEIIFMGLLYQTGEIPSIKDYVVMFILRPTVINITVFFITSLLYHGAKGIPERVRATLPLVTFMVLLADIIYVHYIFPVLYSLIFIPVFMSIVYADDKITRVLMVISMITYAAVMAAVYMTRSFDLPARFWFQVILGFVIMPLVSTLALAIARYEKGKEQILRDAGEKNEELQEEVLYDGLTKIYNYAGINGVMENFVAEAAEHPKMLLHMAILDIDFFKQVNDTYGHESGNVVLERLGGILSEVSSNQIIVGRFGGEEFAVIFTDMPQMNAKLVLNDIFVRFSAEEYPGTPIDRHITFSAGLATYRQGETVQDFFKRADAALYEAKENGRRQIRVAEG